MLISARWILTLALAGGVSVRAVPAQGQAAAAAPHVAGTVKSVSETGVVVASASGDVAVTVPATAKVLIVAPGSKDLKSATTGALSDVTAGDRVIVNGTEGDTPTALTASRVVLMKSTAISETHAAEEAAWAQGIGGIVKSVDSATGSLALSSGGKTVAVQTTAKTVVRHYANDSVRFQDATTSSLAQVLPGDQLRVRGTKSPDGLSITADEIVAGSFHNYSGLLTGVDAAAGTVTLKDLATKKVVTVKVTGNSDMHRLPPGLAQTIAARLKGAAGASATAGDSARRSSREGSGLSGMMSRLPAETLGGLKTGEAVMVVATGSEADDAHATAVTLLVGVEPILTAPAGETMRLSPWSLGGSGGGADAGGGGL